MKMNRIVTDTCPLKKIEGHLVVEMDGKNFLFDLSYWHSWGPIRSRVLTDGSVRRSWFVKGRHICLLPMFKDLKLDGVIGADLVEDANFTINLPKGEITFTTENIEEDEDTDHPWGDHVLSTLDVKAEGKWVKAILATGLPCSMFLYDAFEWKQPEGGVRWHGPLFSVHDSLFTKRKIELCEVEMELDAGAISKGGWSEVSFGDAVVVLGNEVFDRFEVFFNMRNKYKSLRFTEIERKEG